MLSDWLLLETTEFINLEMTFFSGQCFTFAKDPLTNHITGNLDNHPFIFSQKGPHVYYKTTHPFPIQYLRTFFNLNINFDNLINK